jgi:hypothetical protein
MRDKNVVKSFYFSRKKFLELKNLSCKRLLIFGETLCLDVCAGGGGEGGGRGGGILAIGDCGVEAPARTSHSE